MKTTGIVRGIDALGRIVAAAISDISMPPFVAAQADEHGERAENGLIKKSKRLAEQRAQVIKHRCSFRGWDSAPHVSPRKRRKNPERAVAFVLVARPAERQRRAVSRRVVCMQKSVHTGHKCVPTAYAAVFRLCFFSHKLILFVSITL